MTTARGAKPFWLGIELTYPSRSLGYTGILCADNAGKVLCTSELRGHTRALDAMRVMWPGDQQLRFITDTDDLRHAARRSCVFGAVVDAASPAALSLATSLAKTIAAGNSQTALRVLTTVAPPSSRQSAGPLPPIPAPFDVLLQSRTTQPWFEHRDLAVMCALHKARLIGVDFTDICHMFKDYEHARRHWVPRRPKPIAVKGLGGARGAGRGERAAKKAMREIAASLPLSHVTGGIIDIAGDARLKDTREVMQAIRAACPDQAQFVLGFDSRGERSILKVSFIAVV